MRKSFGNTIANADTRSDAVMLVMGENSKYNVTEMEFQLYYPTTSEPNRRYHAALAASEDSIVKHTIVSKRSAAAYDSAFLELKADVERSLGVLLQGVVARSGEVAGVSSTRPGDRTTPATALKPPPYEDPTAS